MTPLAAALALAALAATTHAQGTFIVAGHPNFLGRHEPIGSPDKVAPMVYSVVGASNSRQVLNTPEEQQRAQCTSANVGADKSNYYTPALYYIHDNGTYSAMGSTTRIFYDVATDDVQPFPQGMRIISGTPRSRNPDTRTDGIFVGCHAAPHGRLPNGDWPDEGCSTIQITAGFPSCGWANQSLESWDHFSHMSWPITNEKGSPCPASHPVKYPSMRIVNYYYFSDETPFRPGRDNVILSNGDLVGTSFHAGFVSGWDEGALASAASECAYDLSVGEELDLCPAFAASYQPDIGLYHKNTQCAYQGQIPNEDIGLLYPLSELPGCNAAWGAGVDKPGCKGGKGPDPKYVSANAWKGGFSWNFPFVMTDNNPGLYNADDEAFFGKPRFGKWGTLGINRATVMKSEAAEINGWLPPSDVETKENNVWGMWDNNAWRGWWKGKGPWRARAARREEKRAGEE